MSAFEFFFSLYGLVLGLSVVAVVVFDLAPLLSETGPAQARPRLRIILDTIPSFFASQHANR